MKQTEVHISDIGQAILALDQEYKNVSNAAMEARHHAATWNIKERALLDRVDEIEKAIAQLLSEHTYRLTRLGWRE